MALGHDVRVGQTGVIKSNGETDGGIIRVEGSGDVHVAGQMQARGATGDGGFVHVTGENVNFTQTSKVDARGERDGGFIHVVGGEEGDVRIGGQLLAGDATKSPSSRWWNTMPQATGLVLGKDKTPFAPLWWDRYSEMKSEG